MTPEVASRWSQPELSARTTLPIVFVVSDVDCVSRRLEDLIRTSGFDVEGCGSAEQLLSVPHSAVPCCVLLDASLSGAKSLELQRQVTARFDVPIVFITERPDVRMTVAAMKAGAFDVLAEPVSAEQLIGAVDAAIDASRASACVVSSVSSRSRNISGSVGRAIVRPIAPASDCTSSRSLGYWR